MGSIPKKRSNRERLIKAVQEGGVSLVLGAGVSLPYGVPSWDGLAKMVWDRTFPERPSPWEAPDEKSPRLLPQFLPIVFEFARAELGDESFHQLLRKCLYGKMTLPDRKEAETSPNSLTVVARMVIRQFEAEGARRLKRVITFNVDHLLEYFVNTLRKSRKRMVRHIVRPSQSTSDYRGDNPIPIYHLHGFVPRAGNAPYSRGYEHVLVFTDSQYWASSTGALSLVNTTMGNALYDSHCIFIGLSMTDLNILRWLALRHLEFQDDTEERTSRVSPRLAQGIARDTRSRLAKHFWIRPPSDDPSNLLSEFLQMRGVLPVEINSWAGDDFKILMEECFPG